MADGAELGSLLGDLVTGIDHVGLAVADLEPAVDLYTYRFGLVLAHIERNDDQGVVEAMLSAPGSPAGATAVQLLAPTRPDSPIAAFLDRRGPGLQHLALRVRDVDRAGSALGDAGVRLLYDFPRTGTYGSRITFVHPRDAGGVLVELVEAPVRETGAAVGAVTRDRDDGREHDLEHTGEHRSRPVR